jgi:hypothetical protein
LNVRGSTNSPVPVDFPSPAYCSPLGTYKAVAVPIENTLVNAVTVVVIGVFRNSVAQPLEISTSIITLEGGKNQTAYLIITLPHGNYTTEVFVWLPNGTDVSSAEFVSNCF